MGAGDVFGPELQMHPNRKSILISLPASHLQKEREAFLLLNK